MKLMKRMSFFALFFVFAFFSCRASLGYSILLWDIPEYNLQAGDTVKVFIRSNISHTYAVAAPKTKTRFEVSLWQITEPQNRFALKKTRAQYDEFLHKYARVKLDGLPVRSEAENTAKQVYRLRKGEIIKLLYKGAGEKVMTGTSELLGDWLRVLTNDGTQGWCFSYNLEAFESFRGLALEATLQNEIKNDTDALAAISGVQFFPSYYEEIISENRIDLTRFAEGFGFLLDAENHTIDFAIPETKQHIGYSDVNVLEENQFSFSGTKLKLTVKDEDEISVRVSDEKGFRHDFVFKRIFFDDENQNELKKADVVNLIEKEKARRAAVYKNLQKSGRNLRSANYGQLFFKDNFSFVWRNFRSLVPSLISSNAKNTGTVSLDYFLSDNLQNDFDGALAFCFQGMKSEIVFLYKIDEGGIVFEHASGKIYEHVIVSRSANPSVLIFQKR